jgi:Domain of unknown function (DUF5660)
MSNTKSKSRQSFVDPSELGREAVRTIKQGTVREAQESAKTFLSQLLGIDFSKDEGTNAVETHNKTQHAEEVPAKATGGEIFDLAKHLLHTEKGKAYSEKAPKQHIEAAMDYHGQFRNEIVKSREKASGIEQREMQHNVWQIKKELNKLIESSNDLKVEFASITVEQTTTTVGQYHLNFLEWMLTVIRSARQKVEDSQSWVNAIKGKGAKKSYWGMFKKHGTTFGLSGERAVATQVG